MVTKDVAVKKKDRERIARQMLRAKGWLTCWTPVGVDVRDVDENLPVAGITYGHLAGCVDAIDETLQIIGHIANGSVKP